MPVFFFWEPYTPENTLSANHLITLPVFPTQSRFDTSLFSGGIEDSPKVFFCFVHAQTIFEVKEISAQISQLEVFVWKRLCMETSCFLSFACPIFAYSGEA